MLERLYALSPRTRLVMRGGVSALECSYPLQRIALNGTAVLLLQALDGKTPLHQLAAHSFGVLDFLESLVTRGALTVRYRVTPVPPTQSPRVEVVIPVLDNAAGLRRCLDAVVAQTYPKERFAVTVVDDGSRESMQTQVESVHRGAIPVTWLQLRANRGPAEARNAALTQLAPDVDYVAFTDSDCVPTRDWLLGLASILEDSALSSAGGGVRGFSNPDRSRHSPWLARYEDACASLNPGALGGDVGARGDRISYLAACNLMVRRSALTKVGGFAPGLRLGEDVDLVWRLRQQGLRVFYWPGAIVMHAYRDQPFLFLQRKAAYASSESWLRRHHPTQFKAASDRKAVWTADGALACGAVGILMGCWEVGLSAAALVLVLESAQHAWTTRDALGSYPVSIGAAALARRLAAMLFTRGRALARAHAVLVLPLLTLTIWRPIFGLWLAGVFALAVGGEALTRRPQLPAPLFAVGFLADVLGYSAGRWMTKLGIWNAQV
jgi:mycofactocin system glycosyltransferase